MLTPIILITVNKTMIIVAMTSFIKSPDSAGIAAPKAVANPTAITAQAMSTTIHLRTPTSNPQKSPKECFAYKYGPPLRVKNPATSAKHSAIQMARNASNNSTPKLAGPIRAYALFGNKKIPVPTMALIPRRTMLQKPNLLSFCSILSLFLSCFYKVFENRCIQLCMTHHFWMELVST